MTESQEDRLKRYRRERALWTLEGLMTGCIEKADHEQIEALTNLENVLNELMHENAELRLCAGHLNRVLALADLTIPPLLTAISDAALFLLHCHRERGMSIRASIYDYAIALEASEL